MRQAKALAMILFDTYSEMAEEDQARALAVLKTVDPAVHDAVVQLLVTDALTHALDVPPWLGPVAATLAADEGIPGAPAAPDRKHG